MAKRKASETEAVEETPKTDMNQFADILAKSMAQAIESARPQKKTVANHTPATAFFDPEKDGKRSKLKRKMYQHGLVMDPDKMTNEEIDLCNQVRPGSYCDGWVKVSRRRDRGVNIEYPMRTASQRLVLVHTYGIRSLTELLQRCIYEQEHPKDPNTADLEP